MVLQTPILCHMEDKTCQSILVKQTSLVNPSTDITYCYFYIWKIQKPLSSLFAILINDILNHVQEQLYTSPPS